jgi:hypothetical protein
MKHDERIPDGQFREATGADPKALEGRRVERVFEVEGTDREEFALLLDNGKLIQISCDPGYDAEGIGRTPERWEVVLYDASDTEAGREFGRRRRA